MPIEREVAGENGRWFLRRMTPYRTTDSRIDGVVDHVPGHFSPHKGRRITASTAKSDLGQLVNGGQ